MRKLLMGNEAFAIAALEAGVNVVAGYPGTPSSEVVETIAKRVAQGSARNVYVEWSINEKAALELVASASYSGARTLFTCKQMGLNVASDALMSLNYVGVKGGCVLFVADDPGPISSQTEQDTRRFASFAKVPVLDPATPEQGYAMMQAAFELSELYGTPVIIRPTTRVCHSSAFFQVPDVTNGRPLPDEGFVKDPKWVIFPKRSYQGHEEINQRLRKMAAAPLDFNPVVSAGEGYAQAAVVAGGVSYGYAAEALDRIAELAVDANVKMPAYKLMQIGTPYPFPADAVEEALGDVDAVLAYEELDHTLEDELLRLNGARHMGWEVRGKLTGDALTRGENSVDDAMVRIARLLDQFGGKGKLAKLVAAAGASAPAAGTAAAGIAAADAAAGNAAVGVPTSTSATAPQEFSQVLDQLPTRPPVLCAGCPHRGSFYSIKQALAQIGAEGIYCGDIGCYTLGNAAPLHTTDTCLCMGAGITMAQGFAVSQPGRKAVAFVGDSTFFASGLTGCANAAYNGHDITVCVLDNSTTAMTGGQPHPGTGVRLMGEPRPALNIPAVLEALGFTCIEQANPHNLEESVAAAARAIQFPGPSAVVFKAPCVNLIPKAAPVVLDTQSCTGCKKCITSIGCPGLGFNPLAKGPKSKDRGQVVIDPKQCDGCGLCTQVCPFGSLTVATAAGIATPSPSNQKEASRA